ncbi:MAG: hypothetical protein ACRBFS_11250 [Aureispira sp.]
MRELLDEPLVLPSSPSSIPALVKIIGLYLVVLWSGLLYWELNFVYLLSTVDWLADCLFFVTIYVLLYTKKSSYTVALKVKIEQYYKYAPPLVVGVLLAYFTETDLALALQGACRIGLVYLLSRVVITIYKEKGRTAAVWDWVAMLATFWGVVLCFQIVSFQIYLPWWEFTPDALYALFLILSLCYTTLFYRKLSEKKSAAFKSLPMACFISSAHLIILGHQLNYWGIEYGQALTLLGVGCCLLVSLYAWIKQIDVPVER